MRVADFLELIADIQNQIPFLYEDTEKKKYGLVTLQAQETAGMSAMILTLKPAVNPTLKRWELLVLLRKKEILQRYLYVEIGNEILPVFGFRLANGSALLH